MYGSMKNLLNETFPLHKRLFRLFNCFFTLGKTVILRTYSMTEKLFGEWFFYGRLATSGPEELPSPAEFSSNPNESSPACSFLVTFQTLTSLLRCVWLGLKQNSAGLRLSRTDVRHLCSMALLWKPPFWNLDPPLRVWLTCDLTNHEAVYSIFFQQTNQTGE